jgi:hypothetical protein
MTHHRSVEIGWLFIGEGQTVFQIVLADSKLYNEI